MKTFQQFLENTQLIGYHGSPMAHKIRKNGFKKSKSGWYGPGVYLANSPEKARGKPEEIIPVNLTGLKLYNHTKEQNQEIVDVIGIKKFQNTEQSKFNKILQTLGYHGLISTSTGDYLIFNPETINNRI